MSLPAGMSSGRGREHLSKANPARPGAVEAPARERKPLAKVSAKRAALLGDDAQSTFKQPTEPTLKQGSGPKRSRGKRSKGEPEEIGAWRLAAFERVMAANDGYLVDEVTGQLLRPEDRPCVHHPIEAGDLFNAAIGLRVVGGYPLVLHPDNSMVLSTARHVKHHAPGVDRQPIPLSALRPETWALVLELDRGTGKHEWEMRMRRDYEGD